MSLVNSPGFFEIGSSHNRKIVWYYAKNTKNFISYKSFLDSIQTLLIGKIHEHVQKHTIKFNIKLESTYRKPEIPNSSENRAFKTSARAVFIDTDINKIVKEKLNNLLAEEDAYMGRGSGFTLEQIDGLLLSVYHYVPMGGSSYIEVPAFIRNKKAVINPQNTDDQCFKWAILVKHVTEDHKYRVGGNYTIHEEKYDFTGINFPTPLHEIKIFEKKNPNVSVNVYGLQKDFQQPRKYLTYKVYPLKVVEEEKDEHFDLLLLSNDEKFHYTYIANFSRLVSSQKTSRHGNLVFCKRCFTSFDNRPKKYKLSGQLALDEHKLICGSHKPILPVLPKEGDEVKFEEWGRTERLPFVIYADFEALLLKMCKRLGISTEAVHSHHLMSYGFFVKASNDVPLELLEQFDIPRTPVIFRGSEGTDEVAKAFVLAVVDLAEKIRRLLQTNTPIIMTEEQEKIHEEKNNCDLCKTLFSTNNVKVADHNHLTGLFRHTLCSKCNLKLRTPNFVPCFIHNLSSYDAHFIVRELGYDTNSITVIPNSEEKFISFSKFIGDFFNIRFIDTCRFMASKLSSLAANLLTNDFSKFRETSRIFDRGDLPLVTRKGVYPYEYTDSWDKLEETSLPAKEDFYSTLLESDITNEDYEHGKKVWEHFGCKTLGEYSDLYLKVDVLLLADVFENFRDICIETYNLDPAFYYTAPGFSFDCMLKYTDMKLELLSDYEMLLMFEKGKISH